VFDTPVVLYEPDNSPIKTFELDPPDLIPHNATSDELESFINGVDTAVILLIEMIMVPAKSVAGVIDRLPVVTEVGPHAPVAVIAGEVTPPKVIVNPAPTVPLTV
jgi:hypothetical protein